MFLLQQEDYFVESIKPIFIFYFFIFTTICSRQKSGDQLKQKKERERERERKEIQTDRQTDRQIGLNSQFMEKLLSVHKGTERETEKAGKERVLIGRHKPKYTKVNRLE